MKRISKFVDLPTLYLDSKCYTVADILQMYIATGSIPVGTDQRGYQYESRDAFNGDMSGGGRVDLFQTVSRESREAAAKKAAIATNPSDGAGLQPGGPASSQASDAAQEGGSGAE